MPESTSAIILLCLVSLCLLAMTVTMVVTAREFRETLRRLNAILPGADDAVQEARQSLREMHQLLARVNTASRKVEAVVHDACEAVSGTIGQVARWRRTARTFLKEHLGNGAGADPRRHHRR